MQLTVIGLGLIGASCCASVRKRYPGWTINGFSRTKPTREKALAKGLIDRACDTIPEAVSGSDFVLIAVPMGEFRKVYQIVYDFYHEGLVVTDAGSTKGSVIDDLITVSGSIPPWFIPGHPIAGSERSGVSAADPDLYVDQQVILTPDRNSDKSAIECVIDFWTRQGASVVQMDVTRHDEVLALTSHLPHILAFNLVHALSDDDDHIDIFRYAAGGFRDFTRIAGSDPTMWRDISLANRKAILKGLDRYTDRLKQMRGAIEQSDGTWLMRSFEKARGARRLFSSLSFHRSSREDSSLPSTLQSYYAKEGFSGVIRVPGDKSISHRSIMLGALAEGVTIVEGCLEGEDVIATIQAFREMGVQIDGPREGRVKIYGVGRNGLIAPRSALYLGNSGTSMRLLSGILIGQSFSTELRGDESLSRRPMRRIADPLGQLGAIIETENDGTPPIRIRGGQLLTGCHIGMTVASAQVKSALLLGGLFADGETIVSEVTPTRDHTERMLTGFGYPVERHGSTVHILGGGCLNACQIDVPGDISSAAFFIVAASIVPGSDLIIEHVGVNPTRTGILKILNLMGANIEVLNSRMVGGEPVADLRIRSAELSGIEVPPDLVPPAIDEFPVLFVAACFATGSMVITGAEELRVKESDRIQVMADGLKILGVKISSKPDGAIIEGRGHKFLFSSGSVNAHDDHRVAMAFCVAGLRSKGLIEIDNCANINTSFPNFISLAQEAGFDIAVAG